MAKHCSICKIDLLDEYAFQGHLAGKKHLKNVQQINISLQSVYIYWGHNQFVLDDLLDYLSSFGKIVRYKFGPYLEYGIFQFQDSKTVERLLRTDLLYEGTKLEVRPRTVTKNTPVTNPVKNGNVEETISEIGFTNLKPILEENKNFENQLTSFLKAVALSDAEVESLFDPVCTHLNRLFRQTFPKCRTYRFGSTVTGLCFKKCDLDIYINIGEPISNDENERNCGTLTLRKVFSEAKKLLFRKSHFYSKVIPIPRAKTPIIKFFNIPTKTSCDLSFRNSLGVHNSLLIKHYLSFDPRLKPLMMLIKYWAKHCDISTETRGARITNYALVMLFIFYLEQPNINLVPPVMKLKNPCNPQIIDGWQVNFDRRIQHPSANNKSSILELLHGFFNFYANFDFKKLVICPLDGGAHSKESFENVDSLPECMDRYKEYMRNTENSFPFGVQKPLCIQDPNELNHNCSGNVTTLLLEIFQRHASTSAEVCDKALKTNDSSRLLINLFETMPELPKTNVKKIVIPLFIQNFLRVEQSNDCGNSKKNVTVSESSEKNVNICENSQKNVDDGKFTKDDLFDIVFEIVKNVFEKVFKMKVELSTIDREQKQQKIELDSDVHTKNSEKIVLQCSGDQLLWRDRKIKALVLDPSYSALEKEILITNKMIKNRKQNDDNKIPISFQCVFEKKQNPTKVVLTLDDKNGRRAFKEFAGCLKSKMPSVIEKTLTHMVQYKKRTITFERTEDSSKE